MAGSSFSHGDHAPEARKSSRCGHDVARRRGDARAALNAEISGTAGGVTDERGDAPARTARIGPIMVPPGWCREKVAAPDARPNRGQTSRCRNVQRRPPQRDFVVDTA
jgi:hypothetical protein